MKTLSVVAVIAGIILAQSALAGLVLSKGQVVPTPRTQNEATPAACCSQVQKGLHVSTGGAAQAPSHECTVQGKLAKGGCGMKCCAN